MNYQDERDRLAIELFKAASKAQDIDIALVAEVCRKHADAMVLELRTHPPDPAPYKADTVDGPGTVHYARIHLGRAFGNQNRTLEEVGDLAGRMLMVCDLAWEYAKHPDPKTCSEAWDQMVEALHNWRELMPNGNEMRRTP